MDDSATHQPALSILLPVRNETASLRVMLKLLPAVVEAPHEIVVIVDSPDDTSIPVVEAARAMNPRVQWVLSPEGGVINALKRGVAAASGEYVLVYAADEMGPVIAIEKMLKLMDEGCEFVSCTRYAHGGRRLGGSTIGHALSKTANWIFHRIVGSSLTDCTTGIKMFRRDLFPRLRLCSRPVGWVVAFEMGIKAQLLGVQLGEVPIISVDRFFGGQSTFRLGPWFFEYFKWLVYGARESFSRRLKLGAIPRLPVLRAVDLPGE